MFKWRWRTRPATGTRFARKARGQHAESAPIPGPNGPAVVAGEDVPAPLLDQVRRFIDLNRGTLLDYWEYRIDTEQLRRRLKPINIAG